MISGIAICNVCLKPCKVQSVNFKIQSQCCNASIVHKNVRLTLEAGGQ